MSKAVEKNEKTLYEMYERSKKPLFIQLEEIKKKSSGQEQSQQKSDSDGGNSSGGQQGSQSKASEVELVTPQAKEMEPQLEIQKMKLEIEKANLSQIEQLKKDITELHSLWNAYEAKAVNQLIIQSSILDFENSLNALTKSIDSEDVFQSLLDVTQLYKYLPDFYMAYKPESPPEIGKIKFAAKKLQLLGDKKDYTAAKEVLDYLMGVWLLTRPKLNEGSKDMINQIEFAVSDLKKAIEEKKDTIIKVKTEVILKVTDKLEKANEKK